MVKIQLEQILLIFIYLFFYYCSNLIERAVERGGASLSWGYIECAIFRIFIREIEL